MAAAPPKKQPGIEIVPTDLRSLRACLFCSLVKSGRQFEERGCENCVFLERVNATVGSYTSSSFDGIITLLEPTGSWVAKWQRLGGFVRGCYAIQVHGTVPDDLMYELGKLGIKHKPRSKD